MRENKARADYVDRPLTDQERAFAAEPDNYNQLFKFMKVNRLDQEEWYDILIIPYLNAVKKYCSRPELHVYPFGAIAYKKLSCAYHHYWRSYNTAQNMPVGGFVSLDQTWEGDNPFSENTMDDWWMDRKTNTEHTAINKKALVEIIGKLDKLQAEILTMLMEEYTQADIKRTIGMSETAFRNQLEIIRAIASGYLF